MKYLSIAAATALLVAGVSGVQAKSYTGRFKVDAGTEYVALEIPSSIGGACTGWNAVAIRRPGETSGGLMNVICWKRDGGNIVITARDGKRQTPGPASAWSD